MDRQVADPAAPPGTPLTWRRDVRSVAVAGSLAIAVVAIAAVAMTALVGAGWRDSAATAASIALLGSAAGMLLLLGRIALNGGPELELPGGVTLLVLDTADASGGDRASVSRMWALDTDLPDLARALVLGVADPPSVLDTAVLSWAGSLGLDPAEIRAALPLVDQVPYDPDRRRLTTVHDTGDGYLVVCRGAPETIWPLLITARNGACVARAQGQPVAQAWSAEGLRVLAVATTTRRVVGNSSGRLESGLRLRGMVAFHHAVPSGARDAVIELAGLGVEVVLVSADPRASALAAASRAGLVVGTRGSGLVTGDDVAAGSWPQDVRVFAGVAPQQRDQLVAHWRSTGQIIAAQDGPVVTAQGEGPAGLIPRIKASRHARDVIRRGAGVLAVAVLTMLALTVTGASMGGAPWLTPVHVLWTVLAVAAPTALAYWREPLNAAAASSPRAHVRLFTTTWCRQVLTVTLVVLGWAAVAGWLADSAGAVSQALFAAVAAAVIGVGAGTRSRPAVPGGGRIWVDGALAAAAVGTVLLATPTWGEVVLAAGAVVVGYGVARIVRIG